MILVPSNSGISSLLFLDYFDAEDEGSTIVSKVGNCLPADTA
jgi:hypothetical protein